MSAWSPTPAAPVTRGGKWSPTPEAPASTPGMWRPRPSRRGIDDGGGDDLTLIDLNVGQVRDAGGGGDSIWMTSDPDFDLQIRTQGRDNAGGSGTPRLKPKVPVLDSGAGADLARLGLYGYDEGAGIDRALVTPRSPGRDAAGGHDRAQTKLKITVFDQAGAGDAATGWFSTHAANVTTFTTVGTSTYTIPVWSRYIDLIVIGGGGGGGGAGTILAGEGGNGGYWAWTTIERGNHIPWTAITLTITVGGGGSAGSGSIFISGAGGSGGLSKIAYSGTDLVSGNGGSGGGGGNGATRNGDAPGNGNTNSNKDVALNGQTYVGGNQSTTDTANTPGSGGRGGATSAKNGTKGGRGQAWCCARQ